VEVCGNFSCDTYVLSVGIFFTMVAIDSLVTLKAGD